MVVLAVVAIAAILGVYFALKGVAPRPSRQAATPTSTSPVTATSTTATASPQTLTLEEIETGLNLSQVASLGPSNASKVIVIFYDPQCPFCALELNATLPFLYYISANTSQARVIFIGIPIHEDSAQMLEILEAVYQKYGQMAFANLLAYNYAYYVYLIDLYEQGAIPTFMMPNTTTLLLMAERLGYNVTPAEIASESGIVEDMYEFALSHGITGTPTILAYNSTGAPVYVQVGAVQPAYMIGNLTEKLGLKLPS